MRASRSSGSRRLTSMPRSALRKSHRTDTSCASTRRSAASRAQPRRFDLGAAMSSATRIPTTSTPTARRFRNRSSANWNSTRSRNASYGPTAGHLAFRALLARAQRRRHAALCCARRTGHHRTQECRARQKLLLDELNHRVKNTLATVQSLASQTSRYAPNPKEFQPRLRRTADRAVEGARSADTSPLGKCRLARVALGQPRALCGRRADRVVLRGEDVVLRPRAVLTLAMAVHELTTNAAKYGSLSVPTAASRFAGSPTNEDGRKYLVHRMERNRRPGGQVPNGGASARG